MIGGCEGQQGRQKIQVFKPLLTTATGVEKVTSHAGTQFDALPSRNPLIS
jgi:thymidine kinase